jgi:hypothetical protein
MFSNPVVWCTFAINFKRIAWKVTTQRMIIRKTDEQLQVVFGEVYSPGIPDSDGEYMTAEEIRKAAYRFLATGNLSAVDVEHNNEESGAFVVESFISRADDPDYIEDSWVIGVHVPDPDLWNLIISEELNGFSMEAAVMRVPQEIELELPEDIEGDTGYSQGHRHRFRVDFDDNGKFIGGRTDIVNGHWHEIRRGTITEKANDHHHRYSFSEILNG